MTSNESSSSALFLKSIFLISVFLILVIGGLTYRQIYNLSNSTKLVVGTYKVNMELEQILSYLKDAENGHRNYILTKDTTYLEPYLSAREKINTSFAELKAFSNNNAEQKKNLKTLNKYIDALFDNFTETNAFVATKQTTTEAFKTIVFEEKVIMDTIKKINHEMIALENQHLELRKKENLSYLKFTPLFLYLLLVLILVLLIATYSKITNDLKKIKLINNELRIFKEATVQLETIGKHGNWVWHVGSNTYTFSDNLYRILGEEPGSFVPSHENFMNHVHPDDRAKVAQDNQHMIENEDLPFIYYRILQKDGTIKHIKAYGKLLVGIDGDKRIIGNITDITDEVKSFVKLEDRNSELERNNKELSEFNYVASHDLQEPLRKIQTFISRLEDRESSNLSTTGITYLERINVAATRMRLLIDDLLQFSRTNKPDKEFVVTNLNTLLENVKQDLAETILDKKAIITSDELPTMSVIPFQIQQLFLNLISNSLKYSKKDIKPLIQIAYSKAQSNTDVNLSIAIQKNYHKITITDNGIGFDQQYSSQIFELFSRLHSKQDYSGTGVGLSICKKITDNHDGYIMASGIPNIGATFIIYLPA